MRVKVDGFELGKCYWIIHSRDMEIYVHFSRKNTVYMKLERENGEFETLIMSKKRFKHLIKDLNMTKEEIPASDLFCYSNEEIIDYWEDYACDNGCCSCCGCTCWMQDSYYEEEV